MSDAPVVGSDVHLYVDPPQIGDAQEARAVDGADQPKCSDTRLF
jgi:hypothetical protein